MDASMTGRAQHDVLLSDLFVEAAARSPDAVAITTPQGQTSYRELENRSARIAAGMSRRGVEPGSMVLLALPRGLDFIAAMLGVLRAGGAYVPVDPSWPRQRLDSLRAIVSPVLEVFEGPSDAETRASIEEIAEEGPTAPPATSGGGDTPCYVMFTSGTTGEPKGVVVPNRAVRRLVVEPDYMDIGPGRVWLHLAPTSFDASTLELWAPLLNGGRVVPVTEKFPTLDTIGEVIRDRGVTDAWFTASLFNAMVDYRIDAFAGMKQVLTGGERLSPDHVRRFQQAWPGTRLINGYGPTENTTFTCCHTIGPGDADRPGGVPIGRAIAGTEVRIVDDELADVPQGEQGELIAGGEGVALGYLGQAPTPSGRFVRIDDATWYRTGDLVSRASPDAPIAFHGRRDRQEKIRGHRVELEEVERIVLAHPAVSEAFAFAIGDRADLRSLTVAFRTESATDGPTPAELRKWIARSTPEHLVPDVLEPISEVPVGGNGKADRPAIAAMLNGHNATQQGRADPEAPRSAACATEPRGRAWATLTPILDTVLGETYTHRHSFVGAGGHSVAALRLAAHVREKLGKDLALDEILRAPTLGALAGTIASLPATPAEGKGGTRTDSGRLPASPIQRQFYFENAVDPTGHAYHEHVAFRTGPGLDTAALHEAWRALIARHEALRTRLVMSGDVIEQVVSPPDEAAARFTLHPTGLWDAEPSAGALDAVRTPFDLAGDFPARMDVFPDRRQGHKVVVTIQHAAIDEWALLILIRELGELYRGNEPGVPTPYRVFCERAEPDGRSPAARELAIRISRLETPNAQLGRAPGNAIVSTVVAQALDEERIRSYAAANNATPTSVALAAYAIALGRVLGIRSLAVLTPVSRRVARDLQETVGCCNVMHPVVIDLFRGAHERRFASVVRSVADTLLGVYTHEPTPYEHVAEAMHRLGYSGGVSFGFAFETGGPLVPDLGDVVAQPVPLRSPVARFPIGFTIDRRDGRLHARLTSPADGTDAELIDRIGVAFARALNSGLGLWDDDPDYDTHSRTQHVASGSDASDAHTRTIRAEASRAWDELLGRPPAGEAARFFDQGGHSILLLRLAGRIRERTGLELPLGRFLDDPTFGRLVRLLVEPEGVRAERRDGFQIEELGSGNQVVVGIPGAFGRPISFSRLADELDTIGADVRIRSYNVYDAMSGGRYEHGIARVLERLRLDLEHASTVGVMGYCAGGLYPFMLDQLSPNAEKRSRLWLLNVYPPAPERGYLADKALSIADALRDPARLPAALATSIASLWNMGSERIRACVHPEPGLRFNHHAFIHQFTNHRFRPWDGAATMLIAGRKPIWRSYYRNERLNGFGPHLRGDTRSVVLPLMHHELLAGGVPALARAMAEDLDAQR